MCFVHWDTDVFSDINISTALSTCTVIVYSKTTSIKNKTTWINGILKHTSVTTVQLDYVTDSVRIL